MATSYTGTIHFTSTDKFAALPGTYTFQASDAGYFSRENRGLNLARDFKLFVDYKQAMLICKGAVGGYVAEAADEK